MLCDSPEPAVAFARAFDAGAVEDEAKDKVGKATGREVCDKFMGLASIGEVRTRRENGVLYGDRLSFRRRQSDEMVGYPAELIVDRTTQTAAFWFHSVGA